MLTLTRRMERMKVRQIQSRANNNGKMVKSADFAENIKGLTIEVFESTSLVVRLRLLFVFSCEYLVLCASIACRSTATASTIPSQPASK